MTKPTTLQRSARTLTHGQRLLLRRLTTRATAWVRAGRRDDLTGLAAVLGCILRAVLLAAGAYGAWWAIRRWPAVLWVLVPVWCWAAIRSIPKKQPQPRTEQAPRAAPEYEPRDAMLWLLYDALADRPAMYLSDLLQHLQEQGHGKGWKVADLRARLEALNIPVEMKLKTGGRGASRGIVRAQLPPLPDLGPQEASPAASPAA
ncbi:hypothetical protein ACIPRU_15545 [Streptomyces sp. NPDC090126]|uniref:hypothetical protein n=1 Tax=Streptomyces sp. NPDC090126 TaxID=3365952 RepID=UPI00380252B7